MKRRAMILAGLAMLAATSSAHAQPPSRHGALQRLEDIEAIRNLLVDYGRTLDRRDFAAYAALFARDGVWDGGFGAGKGPAAIEAMMRKNMGGALITGPQSNFHIMSNFRIDVSGDTGTAWSRWTFVSQQGPGGKLQILYAGRYDDELVREDVLWKFKLRKVTADAPGQAPPAAPSK